MIESLIYLLVIVAIFIGAAWGALWLINNFFPAPWHMIAKVIAGLIFLIILLLGVAALFGGNGGKGFRFPSLKQSSLMTIDAPVARVTHVP